MQVKTRRRKNKREKSLRWDVAHSKRIQQRSVCRSVLSYLLFSIRSCGHAKWTLGREEKIGVIAEELQHNNNNNSTTYWSAFHIASNLCVSLIQNTFYLLVRARKRFTRCSWCGIQRYSAGCWGSANYYDLPLRITRVEIKFDLWSAGQLVASKTIVW